MSYQQFRATVARDKVIRLLGLDPQITDEDLWPAVAQLVGDTPQIAVWSDLPESGGIDPFALRPGGLVPDYRIRVVTANTQLDARLRTATLRLLDPARDRRREFVHGIAPDEARVR